MPPFNEIDILKFMKNLDLSREEAIEVLKSDEANTPTPEALVLEKKAKGVNKGMAKSVDAYGKTREREKKIDLDKKFLIQTIIDSYKQPEFEKVIITNDEREFTFEYKGKIYKIVLSAPRPPKKKA